MNGCVGSLIKFFLSKNLSDTFTKSDNVVAYGFEFG